MTDDGYNARVSAEIRAEMARQRRSQQDVAGSLGWTQPYLARRLTSKVAFSTADIEKVAGTLGVPISQFTQPGSAHAAAGAP